MFATDLHFTLALLAALAIILLIVVDVRAGSSKLLRGRILTVFVLLGVTTAAVGAALIALGHRPREWLHFMYAALTLGIAPYVSIATAQWTTGRRALVLVGAGLATLILMARLYATA